MPQFEFKQGPYQFHCTLEHARRKSIMLRVMPDLSLYIKAPRATSQKWLNQIIFKKAGWIIAQQDILQRKQNLAKTHLTHGSICYYLGEPYILEATVAETDMINLEPKKLTLQCKDPAKSKDLLKNWYKDQAHSLFAARLQHCYDSIRHLALPLPEALKIKSYKSRWGSCGVNKKISLNLELIQYPIACIDYVIFHELCHLRELNHGIRFYALMDQAMKDWRIHRQTLRCLHKSMPNIG